MPEAMREAMPSLLNDEGTIQTVDSERLRDMDGIGSNVGLD